MKKYRVLLFVLALTILIAGCTASQGQPLPEMGTVFWQDPNSQECIRVATAEEAKAAVFDTQNPEDVKGKLVSHPQYWEVTFSMTMCMADVTLMETVDCIWYRNTGDLWQPTTLARCRVNAVYNARPECTLKAGDVVIVGFKASMYVPVKTVQPLKKGGRYMILAEDLSKPGISGWRHFAGSAQYMAIEDQTVQLEVTGKSGDNPKVDTSLMGTMYVLDEIPGCENYLEWGTKDVAAFYARMQAAEEERLGYTFEYYGTAEVEP